MKKYFVLLIIFTVLISCSHDSRQNYNIPDVKTLNIDEQNVASLIVLSDAIKNNPSNPENYYKRALVHLKTDNPADALVDITRAERLNPNSGAYLFVKAKAQSLLNDNANALSNALAAESQNYDLPELYTLIADLYARQKSFAKSTAYMQKAEKIYPYFFDIFLVKGNYFALVGDTSLAVFNYKRAIKLQPQVFEGYDKIIKIYNKTHAIDSALVYNEAAIQRFPKKKEMVFNKAQILENIGAADSAIKVYKRFMTLAPERLDVYGKIGAIYSRRKNFAAAINTYEKWAQAEPESIVPLKKVAIIYESAKNYTNAKKYIERALRIEPDNTNLASILASYNYQIEAAQRVYVDTRDYYVPERKTQQVEETVEEKSIFGNRVGPIEQIQKHRPVTIGKDTLR